MKFFLEIRMTHGMHWSGYHIQKHFYKELNSEDRGLKRARFRVLLYLQCPGLLIEAGFITNSAEAKTISTPNYREHMAQEIARGVLDYQKTLNEIRTKNPA